MDLLEAEGVADLIAAETEAQRKQALDLVDGRQSAMVAGWAETLRHALAWQEALIDFPDEDLPETVEADMLAGLQGLAISLQAGIADGHRGARVREGVRMVVTGPPNAGKSTLVNALAKRDVAITAASPGTTRDALEVWIEIAGHRVCLIDTAGLRDTDDAVEAEGVRRARAHAARADVVIRVEEAGSAEARRGDQDAIVAVANKVDLAPAPFGWLGISATTGLGMDALGARLQAEVLRLTDGGPHPALSHVRHEAALREALQFIEQAIDSTMPELRGEALRLAMRALGRISGAIGVEDILDTVFGSFCIGK
jgi:tRNA modification GTPase